MYLIVGGKFQGKFEFAKKQYGVKENDENLFLNLEKFVWEYMENAKSHIEEFCKKHKNAVIICDEVGCGLISMDKKTREYCNYVGEISMFLAEKADEVYYVTMGFGRKLK